MKNILKLLYAKYLERKFLINFYKHIQSYKMSDAKLYSKSLDGMNKIVQRIPKALLFSNNDKILDIIESMDIVLELAESLKHSKICRDDRITILQDIYQTYKPIK